MLMNHTRSSNQVKIVTIFGMGINTVTVQCVAYKLKYPLKENRCSMFVFVLYESITLSIYR